MDIWKHGTYVDMWSVVHVLSGFLLAALFYKTGYRLVPALVSSALLLIAWEAFEWLAKIIEPSINVAVDIVVGLIGFSVGVMIFYILGKPFEIYFYPILILTIALSVWGFIDFKKRGYR
jgi:uncharacterized membrane protein YeaQ/YmgE (transglycosylase-associated protein family)